MDAPTELPTHAGGYVYRRVLFRQLCKPHVILAAGLLVALFLAGWLSSAVDGNSTVDDDSTVDGDSIVVDASASEASTWVDFPMEDTTYEVVSLQRDVNLIVTNLTVKDAMAKSYNRKGWFIAAVDVTVAASGAMVYFSLPAAAAPAAAAPAAAAPAAAAPAAAAPAAAGSLSPFVPSGLTTVVAVTSLGGATGLVGQAIYFFLTIPNWQRYLLGFAFVGLKESANAAVQSTTEVADSLSYYVLPKNWWRDAAAFEEDFVALRGELNDMFADWKARSIVSFGLDVYDATRVACESKKNSLSYQCALAMGRSMTINCAARICMVPKGPAGKRIKVYAEKQRFELDDATLFEIRDLQRKMPLLDTFESARRAILVACDVPHADALIKECQPIRTHLARVPIGYFKFATKAIKCVYQTQDEESFYACFLAV